MKLTVMTGLIAVAVLTVLLPSCSQRRFKQLYPTLSDGIYDTEFPYRNCSDELEKISGSIFKIYCLADYKTYIVDPADKLLPGNVSLESLFASTRATVKSSEASTGTATLIFYDNNRIALLTCAHIFHYPDTIFSYFVDNDPYTQDYLEGISVKSSQMIFFRGFPEGNALEVLAMDEEKDLAIIGRATEGNHSALPVFPYKLGHSGELEWGSFVYMMGFPMGYKMITRGIISRPEPFSEDMFLIDAIANEGFSGSIVIAVRDGVPNFELVGIGKSASVSYDNVLVPEDPDKTMQFNPNVPYDGEMYVSRRKSLKYGVTFGISTTAIRTFYEAHRAELESSGYLMSDFFR